MAYMFSRNVIQTWLAEVFWTCTSHAMSTEAEEVMGLLLGDIMVPVISKHFCHLLGLFSNFTFKWLVQERPGNQMVARIWIAMPQIRSDRRKVRSTACVQLNFVKLETKDCWSFCLNNMAAVTSLPLLFTSCPHAKCLSGQSGG